MKRIRKQTLPWCYHVSGVS